MEEVNVCFMCGKNCGEVDISRRLLNGDIRQYCTMSCSENDPIVHSTFSQCMSRLLARTTDTYKAEERETYIALLKKERDDLKVNFKLRAMECNQLEKELTFFKEQARLFQRLWEEATQIISKVSNEKGPT